VRNPNPIKFNNIKEKLEPADIVPIDATVIPVVASMVVIIAMHPNETIALPALQQAQSIFAGKILFLDIFSTLF